MRWTSYQLAYLADRSPHKAVVKSRRIGFSEIVCFERACRAAGVELWPGKPPKLVKPVPQLIYSAGKAQAVTLLDRVTKHLRVLERAHSKGKLILQAGREIVRLTNGVELRAISTNSRTGRGFEGDVFLDEFAHVMRQDDVWAAASPMADATLRNPDGYHIVAISTPLGDDNLFYRICAGDLAAKWSVHRVDIHRALSEGFEIRDKVTREVMTLEKLREDKGGDADVFAQEYECSFMASSMRYIDRSLWENAAWDPDVERPEGQDSGMFGGMDYAEGGHESVIADLSKYGETLWQMEPAERRRLKTDENGQHALGKHEDWAREKMQFRSKFAIDTTGVGSGFGQRMEAAFPMQAESVKFNLQSKEEIMTGLKLGLSSKRLRPLASDTDTMRGVLSIKRTITAVGNVQYHGQLTAKKHADGAWALGLAVYAAGGVAQGKRTVTRAHVDETAKRDRPVTLAKRKGEMFR